MSVDWFGLKPGKNKKRCKLCARAQHVQCISQVNFLYNVVMPLSRCANVLRLVSLAQKFTNSEDPVFKMLPSLSRAACAANHWVLQLISFPYGGHRPTKFESYPSTCLACSLEKIRRAANFVHVPSTCNIHTRSTFYAAS